MKRFIIALTTFCLIFTFSVPQFVYASDGIETVKTDAALQAQAPSIPAKSGILMEQSTGAVLYEKNPHEKMPPASITKIMTMLLVMEAIESEKIAMSDMVATSANAASMGGTQIWLKENEQMSVFDLMKACAVASANDAAMALAEHVGGSEEGFVAMMNNKAQVLSMSDTTFKNPTGLDAVGHLSSAFDIAIMSKELLKHKDITNFTSIWTDSLRDGKTSLVNTNKLVRFYNGCTGLKTGTTSGAGSCVSVCATKNDMQLISVVMGCTTSKDRFAAAKSLLNFGFAGYTIYQVQLDDTILTPVLVKGGTQKSVSLSADASIRLVLPKEQIKAIKQEVSLPQTIDAPIVKGQKLGEIILKLDSKGKNDILAAFPLTAKYDVEKMTLFASYIILLKRLFIL